MNTERIEHITADNSRRPRHKYRYTLGAGARGIAGGTGVLREVRGDTGLGEGGPRWVRAGMRVGPGLGPGRSRRLQMCILHGPRRYVDDPLMAPARLVASSTLPDGPPAPSRSALRPLGPLRPLVGHCSPD